MPKNIAILIGVADYATETKLPPCESDVDLVADIVVKSGKYAEHLILRASPKSIEGKERLAQFIRSNEGQEIDELLFYYSGHGARHADDFLYLFSDFSRSRLEQTSLRNSELDSMLRSLKPKLAVKVVDACQAGTEYIKSDTDLRGILEKSSTDSFGKTYFLFSSSQTQSSVALGDFSVFTRSFAEAVAQYKGSEVRYRDIMAYISDDDHVKKYQTPLFIQQANNTEVFCLVTDEIAQSIASRFSTSPEASGTKDPIEAPASTPSFGERILEAARRKSASYCDKDEAQESLNAFLRALEHHIWRTPLDALYRAIIARQADNSQLPGMTALGEWLKKSPGDYFASLTYREEQYEARERIEIDQPNIFGTAYDRLLGNLGKRYEYKPVTRTRSVLNGFKQTATSPCSALTISLEPQELALPWFQIFVPYIFSKSTLTAFLRYEREKEFSWENRVLQNTGEWQTFHCGLKDHAAITAMARDLLESATSKILADVAQSVDIPPESEAPKS